ncbi:Lipase 1 [Cytospora mali]|uniref:Lipase 1 n=1 Tax=Cytospora mali TaxID=578113 RepID=A0A194VK93_CYTMA|nr:Lipase 1 [Valsa mali]
MRFFILVLILPSAICKTVLPNYAADQQVLNIDNADPPLSPQSNSRQARGFVSLGDSYSAGIGTGIDGKELTSEGDCRRGVHAYPQLIHHDLDNTTHASASFQWLSCTGAVTTGLLSGQPDSQIDLLNTSLPVDFATLSIGGNDLGFFSVMNACIFRFYGFYSGTCKAALAAADAAIRSNEFELRLEIILQEILDKVAWEKRPWFSIAVTGYARFFNDETPECDGMSLGVWYGAPKLSRDIRSRMNQLVVAMNAMLRRTVALVNGRFEGVRPRVLFVDYDALFDGHRFCEPGVAEPDFDRTNSWFFLVGGPDNARNQTAWPNGTNGDPESMKHQRDMAVLSPNSPLVDPDTCLANAEKRGDWGELALCYMAIAKHEDPSLRPAYDGVVASNGMWWVPTSYGKTFHPRTLGHEVIRDAVYQSWEEYGL